MANLQDGFFVRTIDELDPATGIASDDGFVVEQNGTARRATLEQVQAGFTTAATFTGHTGDTANPHATTAAQVGALTTAQTNAAIASATGVVNTALTTHTGNTANPHATTAAQVGAFTTAQTTSAINAAAATVNTALTTHVNNVSNPHGVTADQVGRTLNQWNANQIQYRPINIPFPAPDGAVLIYDAPSNSFTLATIAASNPPHPVGAVQWLPYVIPSGLYTDVGGWLWYQPTGSSIGKGSGNANIANDGMFLLYSALWANAGVIAGYSIRNSSGTTISKGANALADWNANNSLSIPSQAGRTVTAAGSGPGLTARSVGQLFGAENRTITLNNLPEIRFRRNNGNNNPNEPFSITADNDKDGYDPNATGAINVGSPNTPLDTIGPTSVMTQIWFTAFRPIV